MSQPEEQTGKHHGLAGPDRGTEPAATAGPQGAATVGRFGRVLPEMSAPSIEPLRILGEYQLLEKLGEGGMGSVYKARHLQLDRLVAIKVLAPALMADPQAMARFRREIKAVGQLDHPNIVRAHDARQIEETHILVMEYVDGIDLAELVRRLGPLSVPDACNLIRQSAIGLHHAHQHQLVHRDIKPSNLILLRGGVVKILDLGLARIRTEGPVGDAITATGLAMGTPDFMAPEQVTDSRDVDIRADIYSLGCTFYKLLCGHAPFESRDQASAPLKMAAHVRDPIPPIRRLRSEIPDPVAGVIDRMLCKRPEDRYANPREIVTALEPACQGSDARQLARRALGDPKNAPTLSPTDSTVLYDGGTVRVPDTKRNPTLSTPRPRQQFWVTGLALCGLGLLTALAAWGVWSQLGSMTHQDRTQTDRREFRDSGHGMAHREPIDTGDRIRTDASGSEFHSGDADFQSVASRNRPEPLDWIVWSWPAPDSIQPSLWLLRPTGERFPLLAEAGSGFDTEPAFSPDGRHIAWVRGDPDRHQSSLWVCEADGSAARELVRSQIGSERLFAPVWVTNTQIYYSRDPRFDQQPDMEAWQVGLDGKPPQRIFEFRKALGSGAGLITDISPTRTRLLVVSQQPGKRRTSDIFTTDLHGGDLKTVWKDDSPDNRAIWSPNGRYIAWHHMETEPTRGKLPMFQVAMAWLDDDGSWARQFPLRKQPLLAPLAWSPNGDALLTARIMPGPDQQIRAALILIDLEFRPIRMLFDLEGGRGLAAGRQAGRIADWAILPPDIARKISARKDANTPDHSN